MMSGTGEDQLWKGRLSSRVATWSTGAHCCRHEENRRRLSHQFGWGMTSKELAFLKKEAVREARGAKSLN